jgi:hypothetical protein
MTQREEVRFKVYTKASTSLVGGEVYPLELIDFIKGDGTYDTTTYKYIVQNAGTYLLGVSYNKRLITNTGSTDIKVDRVVDGVNTTISINRIQEVETGTFLTMNCCLMYKLEVGDELYCLSNFGNPLTNLSSYTTNDTLNSFWRIRMDY